MSEVHVHGVVSASEPDGAAPAGKNTDSTMRRPNTSKISQKER